MGIYNPTKEKARFPQNKHCPVCKRSIDSNMYVLVLSSSGMFVRVCDSVCAEKVR